MKKIYKGNLQISDVVEASENEIKQIISQKMMQKTCLIRTKKKQK